ncbi:MAG: molybdenum cofactor guanylyltransferase MobA [Devosia sp.]
MADGPDIGTIACVILAGGKSSRMGVEKALVMLGGTPLVVRAIARLRNQVGKLVISSNGDTDRFRACGIPVVADIVPDCGPAGGLLAGLRWAQSEGASFLLTVACDTPFFPEDLAFRLAQAIKGRGGRTAVARSGEHDHYTFALHPTGCVDELESWLILPEHRSLRHWIAGQQPVSVDFEGNPDPFFNINTPMDLALAETWVSAFEKYTAAGPK